MIKIDIPKIPLSYVGSGDLFAALFLAHSTLQSNLKEALEKTINTLHAVLLKTMENVSGIQSLYFQLNNLMLVYGIKFTIENFQFFSSISK